MTRDHMDTSDLVMLRSPAISVMPPGVVVDALIVHGQCVAAAR